MEMFKDFLGKDLDDCISQAIRYYNCPRENLEVEIVQDAKSGIFGIVGARKAKIRARRAQLAQTVANILGKGEEAGKQQNRIIKKEKPATTKPAQKQAEHTPPAQRKRQPAKSAEEGKPPKKAPAKIEPRAAFEPEPAQKERDHNINIQNVNINEDTAFEDLDANAWPERKIEDLDKAALEQKSQEIVSALLRPLAGRQVEVTLEIGTDGPRASVQWEGDAGILIGRDGQTLAAIQYLASRMLSHAMGSALKVRLDIGDYRAKQEDRLRGLAKSLAERARQTGRPYSTRPLSSYHRRVIHLSLQDETDIQTRSIGEGSQKRVLISPRRTCQQ